MDNPNQPEHPTTEKIRAAIKTFEALQNRCCFRNRVTNYGRALIAAHLALREQESIETNRAVERSNERACKMTSSERKELVRSEQFLAALTDIILSEERGDLVDCVLERVTHIWPLSALKRFGARDDISEQAAQEAVDQYRASTPEDRAQYHNE